MGVLHNYSDWESFSDSCSSEGTEDLNFFYGGQAHSILSSLEESLDKIDDFLSFERGYIHGDIVCSVTDPSGQMGRVVNVKKLVDLENINGKIVKDVDSKKLLKICSISVGDYVVHGPWIGIVDKVNVNVSILFDDGTKCEVKAWDQEKLLPISPNLLEDSTYPYYPGQRVQVELSTVSKSARWLCGAWKDNQDTGTVIGVKPGVVHVDWLACALAGCDSGLPAPPCLQDAKNLTLLSCFPHEKWQLGDWCILPTTDCKKQISFDASTLELIKEHETIGKGFKRQELHPNFPETFVIVSTKTIVDILWQDGGSSLGLDSESLILANINSHEFWPGQFVLEKGTCDDSHIIGNEKWGVVIGADAKERTVKVKWKSIGVHQAVDDNQMEEIVSAYELAEHPDYSYSYGDVIFKHVGQPDKHYANRNPSTGEGVAWIDCPSRDYLSNIGYVTGFKNDAVEVTWASALKTQVAPNDIFRIDKFDSSTATSLMSEQNVTDLNQEMFDHNRQFSSVKGEDVLNSNGIGDEHKCPPDSCSVFLPQPTNGFFMSITTIIFGSFGSTSLSAPKPSGHVSEERNEAKVHEGEGILEICDLHSEMQPMIAGEMQTLEHTSLKHEVSDIYENKELQSSSTSKGPEWFRQFDMVGDCSDHHFLDGPGKGLLTLSQVKRGWFKKVQQEWSILKKDLPESIYVRIYEERMDLLRAAIVGASGTPYHDALFFFDILLPSEYPYEPPLVHYYSGGLRINPNLYESGKICLSLLNTWTGTGTEAWNPGSSSILQILLSLQALVLNEKPYFNEAGYDRQVGRAEGEKNSISYNENAFLTTWKSMLYLLRHPPKHFEALVEEHLRGRSRYILSACKAYMEGAPVAYPLGCGDQKDSSTGFKIMLAKLFPKLVEAFSDKGIDCSQFTEPG